MRAWQVAILLAASLTATGCEFDLTPVQRHAHARLFLWIDVDEANGPLDVSAVFHPGSVTSQIRTVSDDSLRLNGVAFAPDYRNDGAYVYSIYSVPPSTQALRITPPRVVDFPEATPEVVLERVAVIAPDTLLAQREGEIEITVSGVRQYPAAGSTGFWSLKVHKDHCQHAQVLSLSGSTVPPVLKLKMTLLPADLQAGHLEVQGYLRRETESPGGSYEIAVMSAFGACIPFRVAD